MNERIFELSKQAGFIEDDDGNNLHVFDGYEAITCTEELKKFAELLVQEYAKRTIQGLMSDPAFVQAMDEYYENKWSHRFD